MYADSRFRGNDIGWRERYITVIPAVEPESILHGYNSVLSGDSTLRMDKSFA